MRAVGLIVLLGTCGAIGAFVPAEEAAIRKRIATMSVLQKARQLDMYRGTDLLDGNGALDVKAAEQLLRDGVGSIHDFYPPTAAYTNELQRLAAQHGQPPVLFIEECLHGYQQNSHTVFPAPIGLGAAFSTELVHEIGQAIATEARAYGIHFCLAPVLGVMREPRWGRVEEGYGESEYLNAQYAIAMVSGMQQNGQLNSTRAVVSEPKHYVAHSVPEGGRNTAPVHVGRRELLSVFMAPFEAAVRDAGALSVMAAYSETDGVPNPADSFTLTDMLRTTFGFEGFVLSDLGAIAKLNGVHAVASTVGDAIKQYLQAGGNMQFYDFSHDDFQGAIVNMVGNGTLDESLVDMRVADVLRVKMRLGLNEGEAQTDEGLVSARVFTEAHCDLAERAARESVVLLQNQNLFLPFALSSEMKGSIGGNDASVLSSLVLVGPSADELRLGDYAGGGADINNRHSSSVLQGVAALLSGSHSSIALRYEPGTGIQTDSELSIVHRWHYKDARVDAEYFAHTNLTGSVLLRRTESEINFHFYFYGPSVNVTANVFSVRWRASVAPPCSCDDARWAVDAGNGGARLYVDGRLVIDAWNASGGVHTSEPVALNATRQYAIVMEYWKQSGDATASLMWNLVGAHGMERAVSAVSRADAAVVVLGDDTKTCGEGHDRTILTLPGRQQQLLDRLLATGTPVVLVLLAGRPVALPPSINTTAILAAFKPGQAQGTALADVLFGRYSPAGRLSMTWPLHVGQLPMFFDTMPSSHSSNYITNEQFPLYPFGFGLTYTDFSYTDLAITPTRAHAHEPISISFTLTNIGSRDSDDVPQLYVRRVVSSVTTPQRALKGFRRVRLLAGTSQRLTFTLEPERDLRVLNRQWKWAVEPTLVLVTVAPSSDLSTLQGNFTLIE